MSKVFGSSFGMIMQESIPEPQQVSPQRESPAPMTGQGVMQPPSQKRPCLIGATRFQLHPEGG